MVRQKYFIVLLLLVSPLLLSQTQPAYDVLIKGGRVLDGAGNPWFAADVAIRGDRIVRIGRFEATAARVIDAAGLYIVPGFIDIMDQSAAALMVDGKAQSKVRQGVTTGIAGEGGTPGPPDQLDKYFDAALRRGIVIFDYEKIEDMATYENPHQYPKGIPYVLVNGQLVVDKGEHTGATPGRIIYGPGKPSIPALN